MLRLLILRHMKTGWALPGQRDIDRELAERGHSDLAIVRGWLREHDLTPDHICCSSAARTQQTLEGISPAFTQEPTIEIRPDMYSGFTDEYLDCIRVHPKPEAIMMIGHNPTCASLAAALAGSGDAETLETLSYKFPTGALAVIEFDAQNWSDIREGSGRLTYFLLPSQFR